MRLEEPERGSDSSPQNTGKTKRTYRRHSAQKVARLERMFRVCPHPDEERRRKLGQELGLDSTQIKFWFQNKRTQLKTLMGRSHNNALRLENQRIQQENLLMKETLKKVVCASCGGKHTGDQKENEQCLQNLRMENFLLTQQYERVSKFLASNNIGTNSMHLPGPSSSSSNDNKTPQQSLQNQTGSGIPSSNQCIPIVDQNNIPVHDQQIPVIPHDQHMPVVAQDQHIPIAPNQQVPNDLDQLNIPAPLNQHIPVVNQNIHDQDIPVVAPYPDPDPDPILDEYYIPTLTTSPVAQNIPPLDQDFPPLISSLDHNVPALVTALDQNIPSLIPHHDQHNKNKFDNDNNIPVAEKDIEAPKLNLIPAATPSALHQDVSALNQNNAPSLDLDLDAVLRIVNNDDKSLVEEISNTAMQELMKLLSTNEPFWFRSLVNGKFVLHRESYHRIFRRTHYLKGPHARLEASKDSQIVRMSGPQLVEMFLNADKWVDLFPTIVKKAETIQVFDNGSSGSRNGALQLMKVEMHILSPLVPTREFLFIRSCKQIKVGIWVIGDVSFESSKYKATTSHAWRLPSGCLIQEMAPEGRLCKVSWVEHVEVDDKIQTHRLYREVICGNNAYGAERWVLTLERMCERFASASAQTMPISDIGGVIRSIEGRRSVMDLSHRMVKVYCGGLDMRDNIDFPHLKRVNNGEVRVCVRNNTDQQDVPQGMITSVAASFWLPLSPQVVFDFLKDNKRRAEWDILCYGNSVHVMQHISNGVNPNNCTSIIRPSIPNGNNTLILQESYIDALGYMLIYAPFDIKSIHLAIKGEDTSTVPVLSSGFTISWDGESNAIEGQVGKSGGSLVTLANQVLVSSQSAKGKLDLESVGIVNTIVTSTVEKIKVALKC